MTVTYFHWAKNNGHSIGRSFRPLIDKMKTVATVQEYYVPYSGSLPWNLIRNIRFVYKHRNKTGINHITGDIHYCILGLIGCKSVLTVHDDYAIVHAHRGMLDKAYKWLFWVYIPIKFADKAVCITAATKNKIDRLAKQHKTQVLTHHSVEAEFRYVPRKFNDTCPTILQIGTDSYKNLETTIKALAGIKCKLRVVRKMTQEQHSLAQSLNIDYTNVFNLSDSEIVAEYINSDIVVFPSLYEGLGLPIIEGQATGRAVITSNLEPMNSVSGKAAVLLNNPQDVQEYKDAIMRIIRDDAFREKVILAGLENAKKYTVESAMRRYLNLYHEFETFEKQTKKI
jgi:glycosyltransferase involved in cell wall biosynthesis